MPRFCKATTAVIYGCENIFIAANQVFDLDELPPEMKTSLRESCAYVELTGADLLFWQRMSVEQRETHNNGLIPYNGVIAQTTVGCGVIY